MRRGAAGVSFGLAILLAIAVPARADEQTGRIVVSLRAGTSPESFLADLPGALPDGPRIPQIGVVTLRPERGIADEVVIGRLRNDPRVRHAVPEGRFELRLSPRDPAFFAPETDPSAPPGTTLQWALGREGFPRAWDVTTGEGALVGVIDTGIDATHPDFAGKISQAMSFDGASGDPATVDADGHGTHVASLACAASDNGIGITGAGFHCGLMVLKTDLSDSSVAKALVEAADHGAHAVNMSFGDDGRVSSPAMRDAVNYAVRRGVVLVAAAADEPVEEQGEPANLLQPTGTGSDLGAGLGLSVTASAADDRRASFAGRGSQVSIAAYGALHAGSGARGIFGLYPAGSTPRESGSVVPPAPPCNCRAALDGDTRYAFLPGTSMAAPRVAAAAALVRHLNPDLSALEVVRLIKETAQRPRSTDWNPELGWGILDAGAAVEFARRVDRRAPSSRLRSIRRSGRRALLVRWDGRDVVTGGLVASGIARYELWQSLDRGRARRVAVTSATRRKVRVQSGRRYGFYTVAVDHAGNREAAPARADLSRIG